MNHEREQAMRADYTTVAAMRRRAWESSPSAETDRLAEGVRQISHRWLAGPDAAQWRYLDDAFFDWRGRPDTMARRLWNIDHDRALGYDGEVTDVEHRSLLQARDLTEVDRTRWRERPQRGR